MQQTDGLADGAGKLGDRLGDRRVELIACSLAMLAPVYICMGPWQLRWSLEAREIVLLLYLGFEGAISR